MFKRLPQYEVSDISSIWIEMGMPYQRKIILGCVYREHDHLKTDQDRSSLSSKEEQLDRWDRFTG